MSENKIHIGKNYGTDPICYNRGIGGYTTEDFLKVLDINEAGYRSIFPLVLEDL